MDLWRVFSNPAFNPESNLCYNAMYRSKNLHKRIILAFEDIRRIILIAIKI
jgi:hypothetical protein